jgi:hypothetical protein
MASASGSAKTVVASSKVTPCFFALAAALRGSQVKFTAVIVIPLPSGARPDWKPSRRSLRIPLSGRVCARQGCGLQLRSRLGGACRTRQDLATACNRSNSSVDVWSGLAPIRRLFGSVWYAGGTGGRLGLGSVRERAGVRAGPRGEHGHGVPGGRERRDPLRQSVERDSNRRRLGSRPDVASRTARRVGPSGASLDRSGGVC